MGDQDRDAAGVDYLAHRWDYGADAGVVGDAAVHDRDVDVDAHENALSCQIDVIESCKGRHFRCSSVPLPCPRAGLALPIDAVKAPDQQERRKIAHPFVLERVCESPDSIAELALGRQ